MFPTRLLSLFTALLLAGPFPARAGDAPQKRPLLLANYYCWYHDAAHAAKPFQNWTYPASATNTLARAAQRPGEPPPNSVLRPLEGWYDSADPGEAKWHVQLAQAAGIEAFLVDWWDTHNGLDPARSPARGHRGRGGPAHGHQLERMAGVHRGGARLQLARSLPVPADSRGVEGAGVCSACIA